MFINAIFYHFDNDSDDDDKDDDDAGCTVERGRLLYMRHPYNASLKYLLPQSHDVKECRTFDTRHQCFLAGYFFCPLLCCVRSTPCLEKRVYGIFDISLTNLNLFL